MKKIITALILSGIISINSYADDLVTNLTISAKNCETMAPCMVIKNNGDLLSNAMNQNKNSQETIKLIQDSIIPSINFKIITATALGSHWKEASKEQQDQLTNLFEQLLVRTYATALSKFKGSSIDISAATIDPKNKNKAIVKSTIALPATSDGKTKTVAIDYNLAQIKDEWKIYDVKIENISLVITYRSQFDDIVDKDGIDGLISQLQKKVNTLKK
jgi:phospholipid transport system substrate-binding protein